MNSQLRMAPGIVLDIPERLSKSIQIDNLETDPIQVIELGSPVSVLLADSGVGAPQVLQCARTLWERAQSQEAVVYLGVYAYKKAQGLLLDGKPHEGLALLSDGLQLEYAAFEHVESDLSALRDLMIVTTDSGVRASCLLGSLEILAAASQDVAHVLGMAKDVWEPELGGALNALLGVVEKVVELANADTAHKRQLVAPIFTQLRALGREYAGAQVRQSIGSRAMLLTKLTDAWQEIIQEGFIQSTTAEYNSTGLTTEIVAHQVQGLIGEVESRLRQLISEKYRGQYKDGWLAHIEAKHKDMYDKWLRTMHKEQNLLKVYPKPTAGILDYSLFEDLAELIMAQWQLFRDIFDFGYAERNRPVLYDKVKQIIQVRNMLAHNRAAPENELLRAKVLCTDILLALDRAGEHAKAD